MSLQYGEFIQRATHSLHPISSEEAERAAIATLTTLSEVVSPEATKNLGFHLPTELGDKLDYRTPEHPQELAAGLTMEEF